MPKGKNFVWALLWSGIILAGSITPGTMLPQITWESIFSLDKVVHFIFYAVLSFLILYGIGKNNASTKGILLAFTIAIIYGVLIEIIQGNFIANRNFDYYDIIANIIGSSAGVFLFRILKKQ